VPSEEAVRESLHYLDSRAAIEAIEADPYWPKWESPWWRVALLVELGRAADVPRSAVGALLRAMRTHYLTTFPFRAEDVPAGKSAQRHVPCHCQLGTAYRMLAACGVAVDAELPWIRPWFLRYQLPDGGLNCDEAAYLRAAPRSSVVSTLPPLEALLYAAPRPLSPEEERFLDRGAAYLLDRRLFRSLSKGGAPIDESWREPCFPRFYDYDILRGLAFVLAWAEARARPIARAAVGEALEILAARAAAPGGLTPGRRAWGGLAARTIRRDPDGEWRRGEAATFPLLEEASRPGAPSPPLAREWADARAALARLEARGLLVA
jgi:hypothetical protein